MFAVSTIVKARHATDKGEGNADEDAEATGDDVGSRSDVGCSCSHAARLEVDGGQVAKSKDEDSRPVPKDGVWEGPKRARVEHLVVRLSWKRVEYAVVRPFPPVSCVVRNARCPVDRAPLVLVVAAAVRVIDAGNAVVLRAYPLAERVWIPAAIA